MTNLLPSSVNGFPDPSPAVVECPIDFEKHKLACFQFSSHSSYEDAKQACESVGARLADIESTHGKFVIDRVRSMGGNDFWIGSFINRGRVYRQKGRTSCPIMRGQNLDAMYDLVDCNSANRYVCQKYGPDNKARNFDSRPKIASTASPADTTSEISHETSGSSPVLYIVIVVLVVIAILVLLKFLRDKYLKNKRKKNLSQNRKEVVTTNINAKKENKGIVFKPRRKGADSKRTSIDSAVPPSNVSYTSEKHLPIAIPPNDMNETTRLGRPRVNGPHPTRQPPGISENCPEDMYTSRNGERTRRRHHSVPRSDNGDYYRKQGNSRRYYHSDYSDSLSSTDSDDDSSHSGHGFGPQKVYQRQSSRAPMRQEHHLHEMRSNVYSPSHRARKHDGHQFIEGRHTSKYRDDSEDDCDCDCQSDSDVYHKGRRHYRQENDPRNVPARNNRVPTISGNVSQHPPTHAYGRTQIQYFPQPHRLVSWTNLAELNDFSFQAMRQADEPPRSFPREPIRVRRKIHQQGASMPRMPNLGTNEQHLYESLEKDKRLKKKKTKKSRNQQAVKERKMKRKDSRASMRSINSIQSRKLPTPPPQ